MFYHSLPASSDSFPFKSTLKITVGLSRMVDYFNEKMAVPPGMLTFMNQGHSLQLALRGKKSCNKCCENALPQVYKSGVIFEVCGAMVEH